MKLWRLYKWQCFLGFLTWHCAMPFSRTRPWLKGSIRFFPALTDNKSRLAICGKIQQNVILPHLSAVVCPAPFTWKR